MGNRSAIFAFILGLGCQQAGALSLAPEEFQASGKLACVLAEQTLGYLTETEYGERIHTVLDGYDTVERDTILAKALGYHDGLMFAVAPDQVNERLEVFIASDSCRDDGFDAVSVTHAL